MMLVAVKFETGARDASSALMHQRYHWSGTASPLKLVPESATGCSLGPGPGTETSNVGGDR